MKHFVSIVVALAFFEIVSSSSAPSLAFYSSNMKSLELPRLRRNVISNANVYPSKIKLKAKSKHPRPEMKGSFFSSDMLTKFSLSAMAQFSLPNLCHAAIYLSSAEDQNPKQILFVAKCVVSLVIVGIFISLYIPPSETTLETIERPATRENIDAVIDDLIKRKKI
jgi:hypothetical protein